MHGLLWVYVLTMMSETKWYQKHTITVTDSDSGETYDDVDGIVKFVVSLLIISFYWAMQVIFNVIHTTVAGKFELFLQYDHDDS